MKLKQQLSNIKNNRYYKKHKNFGKYVFVGAVTALLNIFLMWLFIDMINLTTIIGSSIAVGIIFLFKFYSYVLIKMMKKKFLKYTFIAIIFSSLNVMLMWLLVDNLHFQVVFSSTAIVIALFLLRFVAFNKIGLLRKDEEEAETEIAMS